MNKKHILLLEDDEILAQSLVQLLESEGYEITLVNDGEEVLEATYDNKYDMYLLDINVPLLDGIETLKLLRDADDKTPAFFLTALKDLESLEKAFDSGCNDYIKKPFDIDELLIRIKSVLKDKNPIIEYKNIVFDMFTNVILQDNKEINLGTVEKDVLKLLLQHISTTINKSDFFEVMQKPSESGLRVLINKLRSTLDIEIINIKSVGYKIEKC